MTNFSPSVRQVRDLLEKPWNPRVITANLCYQIRKYDFSLDTGRTRQNQGTCWIFSLECLCIALVILSKRKSPIAIAISVSHQPSNDSFLACFINEFNVKSISSLRAQLSGNEHNKRKFDIKFQCLVISNYCLVNEGRIRFPPLSGITAEQNWFHLCIPSIYRDFRPAFNKYLLKFNPHLLRISNQWYVTNDFFTGT